MALMELYAGPFAEARFRKCSALACFLLGGDQDMAQAREIAAAWFDEEVDRRAAHFRADRRAAALVRSRKGWMAISALASAVFRKGEIDGDEVDALCAGVYGGEFRYGGWDKAWPPTLEQIRDGISRSRPSGSKRHDPDRRLPPRLHVGRIPAVPPHPHGLCL